MCKHKGWEIAYQQINYPFLKSNTADRVMSLQRGRNLCFSTCPCLILNTSLLPEMKFSPGSCRSCLLAFEFWWTVRHGNLSIRGRLSEAGYYLPIHQLYQVKTNLFSEMQKKRAVRNNHFDSAIKYSRVGKYILYLHRNVTAYEIAKSSWNFGLCFSSLFFYNLL